MGNQRTVRIPKKAENMDITDLHFTSGYILATLTWQA